MVRLCQGMRIESHENLMVQSIRHDVFGPGRLATIAPGRVRVVHVHHHHRQAQVRVVHQPQSSMPADCPRCDHGEFPGFSSDPPATVTVTAPLNATTPVGTSSILSGSPNAPAVEAVAPGFVQGQWVPGIGGLLDIMA